MRRIVPTLALLLPLALVHPSPSAAAAPEPSLVSFSAGSLLVQTPQEYGSGWTAFQLIDERANSGWATPEGVLTPQTVVIALPERTVLKRLEFDTASIDGEGRGVKNVSVEVSDTGATAGFQKIAEVALQDQADKQSFPVAAQLPGRYVRLTLKGNHGSPKYMELMDFRAYGTQLTHTPMPDVSGTYDTNFNAFHIRQQGTSVTGCYEHKEGLLVGGIEGRVMKLTWKETGGGEGPAILVFSPDGKQLLGLWWNKGEEGAGGLWTGTKKSTAVGGCPHWAGGAQEQIAKDLKELGRTRIYGINFDSDSAVIRAESKPTIDRIAAVLKANPAWKLTIEGHTDSTATAAHNQQLSKQRADAVKAYLQTAGIDAARLTAVGYGATRPVAGNESENGRAQNRRVELVKG